MPIIEGSERRAGRYGAAGAIAATKTDSVYLATTDPSIILVAADGKYVYLPTYVNNSGMTFLIKQTATHSAGTTVYTIVGEATALDGAAKKTSGAIYDSIQVICDNLKWNIASKIGTWS